MRWLGAPSAPAHPTRPHSTAAARLTPRAAQLLPQEAIDRWRGENGRLQQENTKLKQELQPKLKQELQWLTGRAREGAACLPSC